MLIFGPRLWPFEHRKTWLGCEVIVKETKNPARRSEFKMFKATNFFFVEREKKKHSYLNFLINNCKQLHKATIPDINEVGTLI